MPFRARFDCLWCGEGHATRSAEDIEGWASLCPACLGRAQENGFLRRRLRTALQERALAMEPPGSVGPRDADDWYRREGRFSRGPLHDLPWQMELDEVTRWLDALPLDGVIAELAAGSGWWSPLLAMKGELWAYEREDAGLESVRRRLVAHGLRAHLHQREPLAPPDRDVDTVFSAFLLGAGPAPQDRRRRLDAVRAWLRPGGSFAFIELRGAGEQTSVPGPAGALWPLDPGLLAEEVAAAGFQRVQVRWTATAFVMGVGVATRP